MNHVVVWPPLLADPTEPGKRRTTSPAWNARSCNHSNTQKHYFLSRESRLCRASMVFPTAHRSYFVHCGSSHRQTADQREGSNPVILPRGNLWLGLISSPGVLLPKNPRQKMDHHSMLLWQEQNSVMDIAEFPTKWANWIFPSNLQDFSHRNFKSIFEGFGLRV